MVQEALAGSPELRRMDAAIAAQERSLLSASRAFTSPSISLQGELTRSIEGGAGSEGGLDLPFPVSLPQADDTEWAVGVRAALPLIDGGARRAAERRAEENLARLRLARQATAERIEQRLRSTFHDASASYMGIELSQAAAEAADENLRLVTDAYGRGAIPIIELLDAQNAALVADLLAANALYDFLIDLMGMQRAMGKLGFLLSPSEGQAFFDRLSEYFESAPTPSRTH
jgi:outer membrane protein TolC